MKVRIRCPIIFAVLGSLETWEKISRREFAVVLKSVRLGECECFGKKLPYIALQLTLVDVIMVLAGGGIASNGLGSMDGLCSWGWLDGLDRR